MSYLSTTPHPQLSSFDPFVAHPFTSGGTPPEQSLKIQPLWGHEAFPTPGLSSSSQSPASSPMHMPVAPIHAPKPTFNLAAQGVFEQYDRGRVTPDLVVRKKINAWSIQSSFR